MLGSAKTNLPLLTLTSCVKDASPFKCRCIILEEFRGKCFKVDYEIVIELTLCEVVVAVIMRDINLTKKILL